VLRESRRKLEGQRKQGSGELIEVRRKCKRRKGSRSSTEEACA
jgi:hypothetical protein